MSAWSYLRIARTPFVYWLLLLVFFTLHRIEDRSVIDLFDILSSVCCSREVLNRCLGVSMGVYHSARGMIINS